MKSPGSALLLVVLTLVGTVFTATTPAGAIGPFEITDSDSNVVRLNLSGQVRFDFSTERGDFTSTMYFRSIRPVVSGRFLDNRLAAKLHLNIAPGSTQLMDLYFDWTERNSLRVRFGQFKVPFTRYRMQSVLQLTFVDWAITSTYFGAERQVGFALHNGYERPGKFEYVFGIFSGTNARSSHGVGIAKLHRSSLINRSDITGSGARYEFSPELFARFAYNKGGIDLASDSDPKGGPFRYSLGVSAAYNFEPDPLRNFTWRLAPELLIKYNGFSSTVIGYAGWARSADYIGASWNGFGDNSELAMLGYLAQAAYRLSDRWELAGRAAMVKPQKDYVALINLRPQLVDPEEEPVYQDPDVFPRQLSGGLNYYIEGHQAKIQLTADWQRTLDDDELFVLQTQFQLAF